MGGWYSRPGSPDLPSVDGRWKTRTVCLAWFAFFGVSFVLYAATANRGAQWQDSGYHILRIVTQEPLNPLGLALSHPLHHWLGRIAVSFAPLEPCFAITLVSALAAAMAVANTFGCVVALTRHWPAAIFAALSLAVTHTFWQMATRTETYTLAAALLSGECWCLIRFAQTRRPVFLWGTLLLNGLGVSNHLLAALTTPVLVVVALYAARMGMVRIRGFALGAVAWVIGAAPYGFMVLHEYIRSSDLAGTLYSAVFGHGYRDDVLNTTLTARELLVGGAFILLNFPNLLLPAAALGLAMGGRLGVPTLVRRALVFALFIHAGFVLRYPMWDRYTFFLPMYVLLSIFGGIGFAGILDRAKNRRRVFAAGAAWALLGLTPCAYALLPDLGRHCNVLAGVERHKPYRDDYEYVFTPWSIVERSAERMSREAVALAGADGIIVVEDRMAEFAVRYQALRAEYDELEIISNLSAETASRAVDARKPVVLVPANAETPRSEPPIGSWQRVGDLYLLLHGNRSPGRTTENQGF